jgi:archaellum biogenesis ATPase FlaH
MIPVTAPETRESHVAKGVKGRKGRNELAAPLDSLAFRAHQAVQPQDGGKLIRLDQVKDETIQWLFPNQIPLGSVTVLDGSKAEGKSTLTYDLAARLTAGKPMPFCDGVPISGGAILLQAEDDLGATVKKSILAAGGVLDCIRVFSKRDTFHLDDPKDLKLIQAAAKEIDAKLLVADPCTEFFSKSLKDEKTIRQSFRLLRALAADLNMAVVLVRHFTKNGSNALYRGLGGVAVMNAARAALVVSHDPASDDPYQHVLAFNAGNLPRTRDVSLVYRTLNRENAIVVEWLGESKYSADDLLAASHNADAHSQLQEACYVLYSILFSKGIPIPATEVSEAAGDALVSIGTLKRAKRLLKVRSRRTSLNIKERGDKGKTGVQTKMGWTWELPHDDELLAPYKERFEREKAESRQGV